MDYTTGIVTAKLSFQSALE